MKFKQYLKENNEMVDFYQKIKAIYTDCQPFLKDLVKNGFDYFKKGDDLLYSGKKNEIPFFKKSIRKNRKPKDTPIKEHELMDKLFNEKFGFKARSNSLFCTGDLTQASSYGNVYAIFPIGKYKFIYSKKIRDLFSDSPTVTFEKHYEDEYLKTLEKLPTDHSVSIWYGDNNNKVKQEFIQKIKKEIISTYTDKNIMKAISSHNEIMVNCKEYYGMNFENPSTRKIIKSYIDINGTKLLSENDFKEWWDRWI
jgi:hypothetical protein